jgi:hypothetical protein
MPDTAQTRQPLITVPGGYPDIPPATYHSPGITPTPALSASLAAALADPDGCPALAWVDSPLNPNRPERETDAMRMGTGAHMALLEPARFETAVKVIAGGFTKKGDWSEGWVCEDAKSQVAAARAAGIVPMKQDEHDRILQMRLALRNQLPGVPFRTVDEVLDGVFDGGQPEFSMFWQEPDRDGIWCKARVDYMHTLPDGRLLMIDYKATADVTTDFFSRQINDRGHHIRGAHYLRAGEMAIGRHPDLYLYVCQMTKFPFLARAFEVDPNDLETGRNQWLFATQKFAECMKSAIWPSFRSHPRRATVVSMPTWARMKIDAAHDAAVGGA